MKSPTDTTRSDRTPSQDEMVMRHLPLVKFVASRVAMKLPASVDMDDLYQSGVMGLIDAVSKFDDSRGIKFQTYAEFRIRGAIMDELRAMDWIPRAVRQSSTRLEQAYFELETALGRTASDEEVAKHMGISLDEYYEMVDESRAVSIVSFEDLTANIEGEERDILEVLADPSVKDPVEEIGLAQLRQAIAEAIDSLPEKEKMVISLYYVEELTMVEVGHVINVTESRVSQLHSKAAMRIRAKLRKFMK